MTFHKRFHLSAPVLLVASERVYDSMFKRSVVLILEHDDRGALGFVINKKTKITLESAIGNPAVGLVHEPVWQAGPHDLKSGYVLHNKKKQHHEKQLVPGVVMSAAEESIQSLINYYSRQAKPLVYWGTKSSPIFYPYRLLVGHTGWGPGQLDHELALGRWFSLPLRTEVVFSDPQLDLWSLCQKETRQSGLYQIRAHLNTY